MTNTAKSLDRHWWIFGIFIVAIPLSPLSNLGASFDGDWYIHLWFARYFSQFIKYRHFIPWEINTLKVLGTPSGIFYAFILNPIFGGLSLLIGPQLAARALIF